MMFCLGTYGTGQKELPADKWWRDADQLDTPEGNKKYLDFYESPWTMKGAVTFK
jgi:hypothetical protein